MIYEMKYLCSNWEIKTSPFHPNMEILGSFIACINELAASRKKRKEKINNENCKKNKHCNCVFIHIDNVRKELNKQEQNKRRSRLLNCFTQLNRLPPRSQT